MRKGRRYTDSLSMFTNGVWGYVPQWPGGVTMLNMGLREVVLIIIHGFP